MMAGTEDQIHLSEVQMQEHSLKTAAASFTVPSAPVCLLLLSTQHCQPLRLDPRAQKKMSEFQLCCRNQYEDASFQDACQERMG